MTLEPTCNYINYDYKGTKHEDDTLSIERGDGIQSASPSVSDVAYWGVLGFVCFGRGRGLGLGFGLKEPVVWSVWAGMSRSRPKGTPFTSAS